jgi:hypothetical protein
VTRGRDWLAVVVVFVLLTVVMTWPQAAQLATAARQHQDVYFNMWRLGWFAHALATTPRHVFDGNIFYPESRAMTFSDAMLVEGLAGAPLLWLHVPPVLVHNILLLGGMAASGIGMFVLARRLTSSTGAAVIAGIVFAFAPYRFEHYMHMELQWAMWIPWTFWALDRALDTARWRDGLLTGIFAALQVLSSIYYGAFLATLLALGAALLLITIRGRDRPRVARVLLAGAITGAAIVGLYARPYIATHQRIGGRSSYEVQMFSARPSSYLVATPENFLYGRAFAGRGRPERRLSPGLVAPLLALVGLLLRKPSNTQIVYVVLMLIAFETSLGPGGYTYRLVYSHVPLFSGFRAIARLGIFVLFFVAALAAYGFATLESAAARSFRRPLALTVAGVLVLEYWVAPLSLVPFPNTPPPLYTWLAAQPRHVVAEFPMPRKGLPDAEPLYTYMSTFHWNPLVNGYSGYAPASYHDRLEDVARFPDDRAIERLRRDGVGYVVVHVSLYRGAGAEEIVSAVAARSELVQLGSFSDGQGDAVVYRLR